MFGPGQQVVEEILDAQRPGCPPEYMNIKIPDGHSKYTEASQMPFLRSRYDMRTGLSPNNPRQQVISILLYSSPDKMMMHLNFFNYFFIFVGIDFILPGYVEN